MSLVVVLRVLFESCAAAGALARSFREVSDPSQESDPAASEQPVSLRRGAQVVA
jgi:hypothetical protein